LQPEGRKSQYEKRRKGSVLRGSGGRQWQVRLKAAGFRLQASGFGIPENLLHLKSPFAALIRIAGRPGKERTRHGCAPVRDAPPVIPLFKRGKEGDLILKDYIPAFSL